MVLERTLLPRPHLLLLSQRIDVRAFGADEEEIGPVSEEGGERCGGVGELDAFADELLGVGWDVEVR